MLLKLFPQLIIGLLCIGSVAAQQNKNDSTRYYECYVGTSAFLLGNLSPNSPSFYQLNVGYRITPKDVVSLELITWKYSAPLGIPYGPSFGDKANNYPGNVREYGVGVVYQRFLWKGLYKSLQVIPLKKIYRDEEDKILQKGFQLFSTLRLGYHISFFKNRCFIEPSIASTFWPISTNVPEDFLAKDKEWNRYFLFEPGLHFGFKF